MLRSRSEVRMGVLLKTFSPLSGNGRVKEDRIKKAEVYPSIIFQVIVRLSPDIDQEMESPAATAPLPTDLQALAPDFLYFVLRLF